MSLRLKFGLLISMVVLLTSGLGSLFIYQKKAGAAEQTAKQRAASVTSMISLTVKQSVADFDLKTMEDHLTSALKDPEVLKVQIFDPKGEVVTEKASTTSEKETWEFKEPIKNEQEEIGQVVLTFSSQQFRAELIDTLRSSLLLTLGTTFFIVIGSFLLFQFLVASRLRRIEVVTEDIEKGNMGARVGAQGKDEIGRLAQKFNNMLEEVEKSKVSLEDANRGLEDKILERTSAISNIVNNVKAGFFIIQSDLKVQPGFTKSCLDLAGTDFASDKHICQALSMSPRLRDFFPSLVVQVFEDILPEDMSLEQIPSRVEIGGRTLGIQGGVLRDKSGGVSGILFTLTEISNLVEAELKMKQNQTLIQILSKQEAFLGFLGESRLMIAEGRDNVLKGNLKGVKLSLHTLKGNASLFGLLELADVIHKIEDQDIFQSNDFDKIENAFRKFLDENSGVLKLSFDDTCETKFTISSSNFSALKLLSQNSQSLEQMVADLNDWQAEISQRPALEILGPVQEFAEKLSERLGKQLDFELHGWDTKIDYNQWKTIVDNVIHVIRNAIDHGLEVPRERGQKSERGKIWLTLSAEPTFVALEIGDDGRGINAEKVLNAALRNGVVTPEEGKTMTEQDKLFLVFRESVSTAEQITDISGRGVGMSAIKQAVEQSGGQIEIISTLNVGTRMIIKVPKSQAMASLPAKSQMRKSA